MKTLLWLSLSGLLLSVVHAEERPRWEVGVGLGGMSLLDYRGSDERRQYVFPVPYFVYRGDVLKADRDGARAELIGTDRFHLDVGLGASAPVSSQKNKARAGMPNLPGVIEIGPALDALLYQDKDDLVRLRFRVPVTYGVTMRQGLGGNGWQASPKLTLDVNDVLGQVGWNAVLQTGPLFSSRQRHAYYYDVQDQYASADRPAYRASAGYAGTQFTATLSKRFDRVWLGFFTRYENLQGAAFADSPLVKSRNYLIGGVAVSWVFGQSTEMVQVN